MQSGWETIICKLNKKTSVCIYGGPDHQLVLKINENHYLR